MIFARAQGVDPFWEREWNVPAASRRGTMLIDALAASQSLGKLIASGQRTCAQKIRPPRIVYSENSREANP
jgi:hypothetical protein